ncbi:hypothetical protein [Oceanobacillus kimchii]|uniref:hypothetical protein n=1 Tax=Oceanobacillus kimchii TaxID=746691 RepID=UPI003B0282F3
MIKTVEKQNKIKTEDNPVYSLRMKYERSGKTDVEALRKDTQKVIDGAETLSHTELDIMASTWAFVSENIEREEWRNYIREDWEQLEYEHVEKSRFTKQDLFDDIYTAYENKEITELEAQVWAKRYRQCRYIFCLNVFHGRKDQRYCSSDCRKRAHRAQQRYNETGTYLPTSAYRDNREDTVDRAYYEHERSFDNEMLTEVIVPEDERRTYGGKRNRAAEDYREINLEKSLNEGEYAFEKSHENPVIYEGEKDGYIVCGDTTLKGSDSRQDEKEKGDTHEN